MESAATNVTSSNRTCLVPSPNRRPGIGFRQSWMGAFTMNWIEVNGTALRYELSGAGSTTLVLIHEMGGTLDSWDQGLKALNNSRRVLRYDTRGAGLSEKIAGAVTWNDMADDLKGLLD